MYKFLAHRMNILSVNMKTGRKADGGTNDMRSSSDCLPPPGSRGLIHTLEGRQWRERVGDAGQSRLHDGVNHILRRLVAVGRLVNRDVAARVDHHVEPLHLLVDLLLCELLLRRAPRQPPSA